MTKFAVFDRSHATLKAFDRSMALIEFDMQGHILTANANFCTTVGYELADIKGKHHSIFMDEADLASSAYEDFWTKLREGTFSQGKFRRIANGRREIWIEASYNPVFKGSKPIKIVKIASDITASHAKAIEDDRRMAAINRSQAIIEFKPDGTVLDANGLFCRSFGYSVEEIVGRHHRMFCQEAYASSPEYAQFWDALRAGKLMSDEFMRIGKGGGEIWIQATYNPIRDDNGMVTKIVKVATDVTVRMTAIGALASGLDKIANGDLSTRLNDPFPPSMEALRQDFNASVVKLSQTMRTVREGVDTISGNAATTGSNADRFSKRIETQAAALEQTTAALDEITANVARSDLKNEQARLLAEKANQSASASSEVVAEAIEAMSRIEASSKEISKILNVIDEIAFQTSLLALNAGVEAARAGEAGKGFAVVAQEVRELATRSGAAAKNIKELIKSSSSEVGLGVKLVDSTGQSLGQIEAIITDLNANIDAIARSSSEQSAALTEVNSAVKQMDQMTQQNAAMAEESTAAAASLADEARGLNQLVDQFEFGDELRQPVRPSQPTSRKDQERDPVQFAIQRVA